MSIHKIHFLHAEKPQRRDLIEMVILIILLVVSLGFIIWIQNGYTTNFLDKIPH